MLLMTEAETILKPFQCFVCFISGMCGHLKWNCS